MAKIKAGYTAVRCGLETTDSGLAVLEFLRADGKSVAVTMTAENVLALSESLLTLLAPADDTETPSTTSEEMHDVTTGV